MAALPKEKLTLQDIRRDLRQEQKSVWVEILWRLAITLFRCLLVYLTMQIFRAFVWVAALILPLRSAAFLIKTAVDLVRLYRGSTELRIVQDKLVGMYETDEFRKGRYTDYLFRRGFRRYAHPVTVYRLRFASYGEYTVPRENYAHSEQYPLSARGVYLYSECGDTYYLVLSRRSAGDILLAYNTKLFELEQ